LTVDEMTQLAHARGALICFAHMSSDGGCGRCPSLPAPRLRMQRTLAAA
jgi:hypothetical protein